MCFSARLVCCATLPDCRRRGEDEVEDEVEARYGARDGA